MTRVSADILPPEIFETILQYLDTAEVFYCSNICKYFRDAALLILSNRFRQDFIPLLPYPNETALEEINILDYSQLFNTSFGRIFIKSIMREHVFELAKRIVQANKQLSEIADVSTNAPSSRHFELLKNHQELIFQVKVARNLFNCFSDLREDEEIIEIKKSKFEKFTSLFKKSPQQQEKPQNEIKPNKTSFKCVMFGASAVGKSCFLHHCILRNRPGSDDINANVAPSYFKLLYNLTMGIELNMWEIPGITKPQYTTPYVLKSDLHIFMFEFGHYFNRSWEILEMYWQSKQIECETLLIGNKKDCLNDENGEESRIKARRFAFNVMKGSLYVEVDTFQSLEMPHSIMLYSALMMMLTRRRK